VLEAGLGPGQTVVTLPLGDVRQTTVRAPEGVFYVRLRAITIAGAGPPSNEVMVATGTLAPPLAPQHVLATVQGTRVTLDWTHGPLGNIATGFQLQAGTAPGLTNVGALMLAGSARRFSIDAPPGLYYVRLVALNPAGASPPTADVTLAPGAGTCTIPQAPTGLSAGPGPGTLVLNWALPTAGAAPTGYRVWAGSASGAADRAVLDLPLQWTIGGAVPPGPYFLRLAATNACGASPPSAELAITVP
jgi:hypothetical protein